MSIGSSQAPSPSWRETAQRFPVVFLPLLTFSLLVAAGLYWHQSRTNRKILELNQREHVKLQSEIIAADFRSVSGDLMILAEDRTMQNVLDGFPGETREKLAEEFRSFLSHKRLYDQVRYIDETGQEVVRVNYNGGKPVIVPEGALQSKRDRYYFTDTLRLARNEVFISPFDLNVEEGRIERPLKPTIRFATPVFDSAGRKRGILVLNFLGERLIEKLRLHARNVIGEPWLLNSGGYWLAGPNPSEEWGFLFTDRRAETLAKREPTTWKKISDEETGQFHDASGVYTFRTVYPMQDLATKQSDGGSRERSALYYWKIVSFVSPEQLSAESHDLVQVFLVGGIGLIAVLAVVSWFISRLAVQNREAQRRLLQNERLAAVGEAMTALTHECRNALQRSRAGLEMLSKRIHDEADSRELLEEVREAHTYLAELYEEVRGYAAPVNLRRETTDLKQLISRIWSQVTEQNGRSVRPITIETESSTDCNVDSRAMGQVFRNLFENSLAAADAADVTVRMTDVQSAGQPALQIAVSDNGPGIPGECRKHLFEPFFTTKSRGTGLGLAISRRIVEAHNGTMTVAETNGSGAEFIIHLPRNAS